MSLHPDLADMQQRYDQLVDAAEQGHISTDVALSTLAGITKTDGSGAVWSMDTEGRFVRAQFSGAPAVPADATAFVPAGAAQPQPAAAGGFPGGGWPTQGGPTPPAPAGPQPDNGWPATPPPAAGTAFPGPSTAPGPFPGPAPTATPGPFPGPTPGGPLAPAPMGPTTPGSMAPGPFAPVAPAAAGMFAGNDDTGDDFFTAAQPAGMPASQMPLAQPWETQVTTAAPTKSLADREARLHRVSGLTQRLPGKDLFARNKIFFIVLAVIAVIFAFAALRPGDDGSQLPSAPSMPAPSSTSTGDVPSLVDPNTAPAQPAALTGEQIATALSAFTGGNRELAGSYLAAPADPAAFALLVSTFAGLDEAGLQVQSGPTADAGGKTVHTWVVRDPAADADVATYTVTWVLSGTDWKIEGLPTTG